MLTFHERGQFIKDLRGVRNKHPEDKEKPEIIELKTAILDCAILSAPSYKYLRTIHFTEPGKILTKAIPLFCKLCFLIV